MAPSSSSPLCLPSPSLSFQPRNRRFFRSPPASRCPKCGPSVRPHRLSSSSSSSSFSSSELSRTVRLRCSLQRPSTDESKLELEDEWLFSNLSRATLKQEPGSLSSAVFLVVGTMVGARILAIPAVTRESGFIASAVSCVFYWIFMVATGLLIAEVNVNTMCEQGSGGVSLVSMTMRTVGKFGVQGACWSYIFIHYALIVAYVARSSDILKNSLGIPLC